jgi:hypothetical protein
VKETAQVAKAIARPIAEIRVLRHGKLLTLRK